MHGGLEAVPKVDVQQLAAVSVKHEVAGVPVPKSEQVAHLCSTLLVWTHEAVAMHAQSRGAPQGSSSGGEAVLACM